MLRDFEFGPFDITLLFNRNILVVVGLRLEKIALHDYGNIPCSERLDIIFTGSSIAQDIDDPNKTFCNTTAENLDGYSFYNLQATDQINIVITRCGNYDGGHFRLKVHGEIVW